MSSSRMQNLPWHGSCGIFHKPLQNFYTFPPHQTLPWIPSVEKYIFFQKDFAESEDFAKEHSLLLFETGGSVSTAAIDFALRMGCSTLITTGLDLAYPEKKSHAFGISGNISDTHRYISEKDIHGNKILTTATFLSYRKWIEKRLIKSGIECINLTDGLAIKGMKNLEHLDYSSI